jgi:GH18 family chitinase
MIIEARACKGKHPWLRNTGLTFLLTASICASGSAQEHAAPVPPSPSTPLLVGYLPAQKGISLGDSIKSLDLTRMTDLNLAFGDPPKCDGVCTIQSDMTFSLKGQTDADINAMVATAHAAGVKVLVSIGGGGGDQQIIQFYNAGLSVPLIASLDTFVRAHNLDGVDLDIEDPANMGHSYATFVSALISTFHPEGKLVTAAVAKYLQDSMPSFALHQFDFINVMNYSSYVSATAALQFYAQDMKIPKNKLVLGVPFFGSNSGDTKEEDYSTILASYPNAWKVDLVGGGALDDGQAFHYVGESTMAQETQLGKQYGGIMIWEMMGDAPAPHSLLTVVEKGLEAAAPMPASCPCEEAVETKKR